MKEWVRKKGEYKMYICDRCEKEKPLKLEHISNDTPPPFCKNCRKVLNKRNDKTIKKQIKEKRENTYKFVTTYFK